MAQPPRTILLVDGNPAASDDIRRALEQDLAATYICVTTPTAAAARARCRAGSPDAIVIDDGLPDSDALALLAELIRAYGEHAFAIILLIDTDNQAIAARALALGAHDYVLKGSDLRHTLGRAIAGAITQVDLRHQNAALLRELAASNPQQRQAIIALHPHIPFSQAVLDSMSAHIAVLDHDGTILAVNTAWERFGRANGRVRDAALERVDVGTNYLAICRAGATAGAADAQAAYDGIRAVLQGRQPNFTLEYRCDGAQTTAWFVMSVTPLAEHGVVVIAHADITAHRQAEAALRQSEARFAKAFRANPAALVIFRLIDGRFVEANQAYEQLLGYRREELIGRSARDLNMFPEPGMRADILRRLGEHEAIRDYEIIVLTKSGERRTILLSSEVLELDGEACVLAIGIDITERQRAQAALRDSRQQLMQLSVRLVNAQEDERRTLAYELHDEIGQQLTSLNMVLEVGAPGTTAQLHAKLHEAQRLIADLTGQVRQLSLDLRPPMLDDLGLLPTLLWHIQRYMQQTNVTVDFKYRGLAAILPPHIAIAAYRIVQEGLTNVARHAQVAAAVVRVWINAGQLKITIEDQGCGFDAAAAPLDGRSVGLASMHERVQLLGGQFNLDSAPGEGTRIRVTLPLDPAEIMEI